MKILNLVNQEKSDIKYQISKFPDGQQQVKILDKMYPQVQILSRLNNFQDLELICCAVASLREIDPSEYIELHVPYFLGSRSDRKFENGSNNYLKTVICPIINSLKLDDIIVLDPHSDVLEACLNNFNKIENFKLLEFALFNIYGNSKEKEKFFIVSPDAGANKKIFKLADQLEYLGPIITCDKSRDINGKISKVRVPIGDLPKWDKDAIIIDDICDGGRTFINIAKEMKDNGFKGKIYLVITHGIFSAGFAELNKYFNGIFCTNSYSDLDPRTKSICKIEQLNVF